MRIKPILVTLGILGSSSLALADRGYDWNRDRRARSDVTYHQRTTWLALTTPQRLDRGGDVFDLRRSHERFAQLRLQNQTGRTVVRSIEIIFGNGQRQLVHVNRVLAGNHAMVNVDIEGNARRIARIIVDGRSGRGGSYQLYAM